ncbi:MAG: DNA polymerase I, partial [Lutibacter sp.]|nr:DNA polymerase I [Lutibacter sp.]
EEDFRMRQPDFDQVNTLFQELEFRRIADTFARIFKKPETAAPKSTGDRPDKKAVASPASGQQYDLFAAVETAPESPAGFQSIENSTAVYQYVDSALARQLLLANLLTQTSVAFHLEVEQTGTFAPPLIGMAVSYEKGSGYFVRIPTVHQAAILAEFRPFFEHPEIEKIGEDIKYAYKLLQRFDCSLNGPLFDTRLAHYLLHPDRRHDLQSLAETQLNYQLVSLNSLIGKKGAQQRSLSEIEPAKQAGYAAEKTDIVFQLKTAFETALKTQELEALYRNIELPLLRVLAAMELEGIRVDVPFLNELSKTLSTDIEGLEKQVYETAGSSFNLASPKQLGEVLFEQLKLVDKPKKTKTGQYATGEEILTKLAPKHPIVKDILEWRGLVKLKNTYTDALPEQVNPATGKIHTTFSQAVAATGRLSSNHPNLQNIPIRTVRGKAVRKAFIPRSEDYLLLSADYSQIELRIIAALSKDPGMIEAFQKGEDIHAATAAKIFNIPLQEVTKTQRGEAKAVNFGIVYGQGAFTLAQQLQQSRSEAKALIDHYYTSFPTLKQFIANQVGFAREHGYVSTISGRRRYLHNINSQNAIVRSGDERNAVNAPIQGSAADIIKMAMIHIHEHFQKAQCRSKMLLQVHDELVFDIHKEEVDRLAPVIRTAMENAFDLGLPLTVEMGTGHHWLAAH